MLYIGKKVKFQKHLSTVHEKTFLNVCNHCKITFSSNAERQKHKCNNGKEQECENKYAKMHKFGIQRQNSTYAKMQRYNFKIAKV